MTWRDGTLEDLVFLQRGFDITKDHQIPGDIPVISSSGIGSYHSEAKVSGPGVVIGRKGTLGSVYYVETDYWPHDTTLWSKDLKGNDPKFVYYFIKTLGLSRYDVGNSNPTLNRNHIHSLGIKIPDISEQKRIVDILDPYDDLIGNNQRRIDLLEQFARQLFKEWFVWLRYPGHEHYKVLDGIPHGWGRKSIGNLTDFISRGITPTYDDAALGIVINQKCIRNGRLSLGRARRQSKEVPKDKLVRAGDVLVNSTGEGTLGRVAQVHEEIAECTVDSHVTIVRPDHSIDPIVFGLSVGRFEDFFASQGRGATNQKELSRSTIEEAKLLVPAGQIQSAFSDIVAPAKQQVIVLTRQIERATDARDLLLPRLMSGRIAV